ncbi:hypothetical protein FAM18101_01259 [Lacticaseibacillus paracasei]|nr:hypothetical protein FAM18101_01259 [Lacticaseibacillus paracasei]
MTTIRIRQNRTIFVRTIDILARQAEAQPQLALTVADLIDVYQAIRNSKARQQFLAENAEEKTYEWNRFVHDFFADPATRQFRPRLKVAAILWQHVKQSTAPKQYVHSLLQAYHEDIGATIFGVDRQLAYQLLFLYHFYI